MGGATLTASEVQALIYGGLPVAEESGLEIQSVDGESAWVRQPFQANQIRPGGTLSGPTMMALADAAMYAAILGALGPEKMALTQDLHIRFLRPPKAEALLCHCQIVQLGRRSIILEARLYSESAPTKAVALVTGSYINPMG